MKLQQKRPREMLVKWQLSTKIFWQDDIHIVSLNFRTNGTGNYVSWWCSSLLFGS